MKKIKIVNTDTEINIHDFRETVLNDIVELETFFEQSLIVFATINQRKTYTID